MSEGDRISIEKRRIERLDEVLALLSAGIFVESMVTIDVADKDALAGVEERLNAFSREFIRATIESDRRLETIRAQRDAIARLSSPIIEIWDGIILLPLIGSLDEERTAKLMSRFLDTLVASAARWAILDVTGTDETAGEAFDLLIPMIRAARLVGCQCVVSGISPALAAHLASRGEDLGGAPIAARLKDALLACLRQVDRDADNLRGRAMQARRDTESNR